MSGSRIEGMDMSRTPRKGPKPKPVAETRRNTVHATLTDAELKRLHGKRGDVSVSTWVRALILAATEDPTPIKTRKGPK
jgi:hypothetical protein